MNTVIKDITIDVYDENLTEVRAKQYDSKTRSLVITLADEGTAFEVDENATVTMNVRRADNQAKSYFGSVNQDGTVSVPLTYWMLSVYGTAYCDVSIIIGNEMLTSVRFALVIDQAAVQNEDITDDEEYCVLVRLIAEVQDIIDNENSFGTITDGTNVIEAVGVNDLLTLEAGTGVNFTLNPTTKTIRVSITDADTHYHIETDQDTGNDIVIALTDSDGHNQGYAVIKAGINLTGTYNSESHTLQIDAAATYQPTETLIGTYNDGSNTYNLYRKVFTKTLSQSNISSTRDQTSGRLMYKYPATYNEGLTSSIINHAVKISCLLYSPNGNNPSYIEEAEKFACYPNGDNRLRMLVPQGSEYYMDDMGQTITAILTIEYYKTT